jgi:hypothetical protein
VLDYLFRAAGEPAIALGDEPVRYYEFAAADADAPSGDVDPELVGPGGRLYSTPLLPQAPVGTGENRAHLVTRMVMEDIATSPLPEYAGEAARLTVLADLDRLPVGVREEWGQLLLDMLDDVTQVADGDIKWRFRRQLTKDGTRQTLYACASQFDTHVQDGFRYYVMLRHHEVAERTGRPDDLATVGVLLTPNYTGRRPWDTTMASLQGPSNLTPEEVTAYGQLWNNNLTAI